MSIVPHSLRVHGVDSPIPPLHIADNGLSAVVDMDVFDRDLLLPFAVVPIQRFQQGCVDPRQFVRVIEILFAAFEYLLANHRPAIAFAALWEPSSCAASIPSSSSLGEMPASKLYEYFIGGFAASEGKRDG